MHPLHPKLAHLSIQEIESLILGYSGDEPLTGLIKKFNIDCQPSQLHSLLPPILIEGENCPFCDQPMVRQRPLRSAKSMQQPIFCPSCKHQISRYCHCENCHQLKQKELRAILKKKQDLVADYCLRNNPGLLRSIDIEKLSLKEAVGFLGLVRSCGYLNQDEPCELVEIVNAPFPFTAQECQGEDVLAQLVEAGLIAVSENSAPEGFVFGGDRIAGYRPMQVRWTIRYEPPIELVREIESRARSGIWPSRWLAQVKDLWSELAIAECKEFYRHLAQERGFPESGAAATTEMLGNLLKNFSISQSMQIILKGARDAADFRVRNRCTLQHASNYMIGACQRYADRVIANNWRVAGLHRNPNLPQCTLSSVFHDVFLRHGERGFLECPREWR